MEQQQQQKGEPEARRPEKRRLSEGEIGTAVTVAAATTTESPSKKQKTSPSTWTAFSAASSSLQYSDAKHTTKTQGGCLTTTEVTTMGSNGNNQALKGSSSASPPPKYGEQWYWEARYQRFVENRNKQEQGDEDNNHKDEPLPYHSWYFTYDDLRPLLLPLILGGRHQVQEIIEAAAAEAEEKETEEVNQEDGNFNGIKNVVQCNGDAGQPRPDESTDKKSERKVGQRKDDDDDGKIEVEEFDEENQKVPAENKTESFVVKVHHPNLNRSNNKNMEEEDEFVEVIDSSEEEEDEDGDDEDDESIDRGEGLAAKGPIQILEIGCGDVPLGAGLAKELQALQSTTATANICQQILCTDYSSALIAQMQQEHHAVANNETELSLLKFAVADARHLPLADESIDLILEKGTLDAMMSDPDQGMKNCQAALRECARVLTMGGCLVLISHWNAHTSMGLQWLDDVVFSSLYSDSDKKTDDDDEEEEGINANTGKVKDRLDETLAAGTPKGGHHSIRCCWEVEVHGREEVSQDSKEGGPPSGSPGPAVYVIHKRENMTANDERMPVRFYSY